MCISQAVCNLRKRTSFSLIELIIVIAILVIVAGMGFAVWQSQLEKDHADNAKTTLKMVLQAEENYYTWKNAYSSQWSQLELDNPNNRDNYYEYTLENVEGKSITIRAKRRGRDKGFTIDQTGNLQVF